MSLITEIKKYRHFTRANLKAAKHAIDLYKTADNALKAKGIDPASTNNPTLAHEVRLTFNKGHRTIKCDCGMEFVLLDVVRNEGNTQVMNQSVCDFCPYCGQLLYFENLGKNK